jgi:hypothetical protein
MLKKILVVVLIAVLMVSMSGCRIIGRGGEDFPYRAWKHIELHILKFYKELVKMHAEIDRYIFDLDWEDPDNY